MRVANAEDSLLVDISDALSERDRVRFTVHTKTKLPQFSKSDLSVVRQHEEFIWLHDCLEDNDSYAGYIIPPAPPRPDFDASREKLQRLGDSEASMTKEEFAKIKQELEAEYLAIFKKTVAMHEIFLQRLAAHQKFREDSNFKIFLEYENELAVRGKSKKERIAGSIQNIGKSLTDFVITTSQVAANTSAASTSILAGHSPGKARQHQASMASSSSKNSNGNISISDTISNVSVNIPSLPTVTLTSGQLRNEDQSIHEPSSCDNDKKSSQLNDEVDLGLNAKKDPGKTEACDSDIPANEADQNQEDSAKVDDYDQDIDEQYFEKERLFLALYHNSIKETANQADKVVQLQKCVADGYLHIAQQFVKLAGIEVMPITSQTRDNSNFVSCPLPSLTLPNATTLTSPHSLLESSDIQIATKDAPTTSQQSIIIENVRANTDESNSGDNNLLSSIDLNSPSTSSNVDVFRGNDSLESKHHSHVMSGEYDSENPTTSDRIQLHSDNSESSPTRMNVIKSNEDCDGKNQDKFKLSNQTDSSPINRNQNASDTSRSLSSPNHTSEGLKRVLLLVSEYFEQARKIETRIASDEDLKLTDVFLYYKRDTVAAQDLLTRRMRFLAEYETASKNLEKARQKGRTQMQYAEVIHKQAKENFVTISHLAKHEVTDYKQRRVAAFRKAFKELVELEVNHLRSHSQLIAKCLESCREVILRK